MWSYMVTKKIFTPLRVEEAVTDLNPQSSQPKEPPPQYRAEGAANCNSNPLRSRRADFPHRALRHLTYSTDIDCIFQKEMVIFGLCNGTIRLRWLNSSQVTFPLRHRLLSILRQYRSSNRYSLQRLRQFPPIPQ